MTEFPPIPSWDALHPLVVHFPIALLLVAPLFIALGAFQELRSAGKGRTWLFAALVLLALGTVATFVAVGSGEAAAKLAERTEAMDAVLERHEGLAETTRLVFSVLTVILAAILLVPRALRRELPRGATAGLFAAFLVSYGAGAILLANTAHNGGRLVYELGVHAPMPATDAPATAPPVAEKVADD